ncbi:MAG: ankyrin repeat domain-containing protein [Planctomycetota bacterium]
MKISNASLISAIKAGEFEKIKSLLQENPNLIYTKTAEEETIFLLACYYRGKPEVLEFLKNLKTLNLYEVCAYGDLQGLQKLLSDNPYIANSYSEDGFTPLGLACYFGHLEVATFLMAKGAAVNLPSKNKFVVRPIHSAVSAEHEDLVSILLQHGADANARQNKEITPLHQSAHNGNFAIAKLLLKYGANPDAETGDGLTPFQYATESKAFHVAQLIQDASRNTPTAC